MDRQMIDYLPDFLKDIREYRKIAETFQPEFEDGWEQAEYALQESVLMTATDYGLSRWEGMLGITPKGTETLEDRRFKIISLISNTTPYTYRQLEKMLADLCGEDGYEIDLDADNYRIDVYVALAEKSNYDAVMELLEKVIPANLILNSSLKYNQHQTFAGWTHAQMAAYTHDYLRNEVL